MGIDQKNLQAIQDALNKLIVKNQQLEERIVFLERMNATIRAEIATSNQLAAHLSGRGMGSTVKEP